MAENDPKSPSLPITQQMNYASGAEFHRRFTTVDAVNAAREALTRQNTLIEQAEKLLDRALEKERKKEAPKNILRHPLERLLSKLPAVFRNISPLQPVQEIHRKRIDVIRAATEKILKKIEKFQHAPKLKKDFSRAAKPPNRNGPNTGPGNDGPDGPDNPNGRPSGKDGKSIGRNDTPGNGPALSGAFNNAAGPTQHAGKAVEAFRVAMEDKRLVGEPEQDRADNAGTVLNSTAGASASQSDLDRAEAAYIRSPAETEALAQVKAQRGAEREAAERNGDRGQGRER